MESETGKLFIGGISWDTNEDRLREYFRTFGEVIEAIIMKDRTTGRARGFGFVIFSDPAVAEKVVLQKHVIDGRCVEAKKAVPYDQQILSKNTNIIQDSPGPSRTVCTFSPIIVSGALTPFCLPLSTPPPAVMDNSSVPRSVEAIFNDFTGRRAGIVRALTDDADEFYALCDPDKENLCLYGNPDGSWEVTLPADEVPPEIPEPALGINFARDGMVRKDWLSLVAVHSDSWLLSVAFYKGARFTGNERRRMFSMINDLPTVFEMVSNKSRMDGGSKSKPSTKRTSDGQIKANSVPVEQEFGEDEDDEHSETLCGTCGGNYSGDEFWIGCDVCERWFHGKCVKITPAKAESIKQYKCPNCSSKKGRQ